MRNYTAIIVKSGKWYAGFVKEVPGAHSQGKTIEEVKENLKEAVKMVIESNYRHVIEGYQDVIEEQLAIEI
jgi:predicted RNase H-like HicB family nuclease